MDRVERPLSPHLSVYRWMITNTLSILHRLTGLFLSLGIVFAVWWLVALAGGAGAYQNAQAVFASAWFKLPLFGWVLCFFYHLGNGVRHLFWDAGLGFERTSIRATGWVVVLFAVLASAVYSIFAFS